MTTVKLQIDGQVACLTLDDPERHNVLTGRAIEEFRAHLERVEASEDVRVLVVTGSGERTFCAGASLDELQAGVISEKDFEELAGALAKLAIPKIAAMNGNAYGGGAEIGLCCDFRLGVEGMKVRVPAARAGLCYPPEGIQRYVRELGPGPARLLLVSARTMDAGQLLHLGYLHEVCPANSLAGRAQDWANGIAELAPLSVRAMLAMCKAEAEGRLDSAAARSWAEQCGASADRQEGLQAMLQKRKPEFRGR